MSMSKAFYAYPAFKPDLLEDIRGAVKIINDSKTVSITTWEDLSISGKFIIDGILESIDKCDLFICDLTYLNYNVLYELGYAIAKGKKIWITLNRTHANAVSNYKSFKPLTTVGYAAYENTQELVSAFFSEVPYEYSNTIDIKSNQVDLTQSLIYLKCDASTSASNMVTSILNKSQVPMKLDDPYEGFQPLSWYLGVLPNALGVVIHFHTSDSEKESPVSAGRKAMVAGLAYGLGKETLLLAHSPYSAPLDFHDELKIHNNANQCEVFLREWITPIGEVYRNLDEKYKGYKAEQKALGKISNLIMGDYVAENENQDLLEYFLETAEYKDALTAQQVLFVGRKGTGKTANLIKLKNELSSDKRNVIIPIQPQGHEFEGVINVLNRLISRSEQGHLIESIWKFLIYTEIARQYYDHLQSLPLHHQKSEDEELFLSFVKQHERLINADFTLRIENMVNNLDTLRQLNSTEEQRLKVSEFLHDTMIKKLRDHLGNVFKKKEKVTLLIDNLDKSWNDNADLERLSELLFGLLNVVHKITEEFQRNSYKHVKVNLSLIVFLRSDIFNRIMSFAPERDKIPIKHLSWTDSRLLFRVIENRIEYSSNGVANPDILWGKYFCREVKGVPLKEYIADLILPRPRDIVFLIKAAFQEAVNRGHFKVEEQDFISAEYSYSEYALQSLFPENGGRIKNLESILYEFAGENSVITQEELENCIRKNSSQDIYQIINILCEMTFLGQEIQENKFEYYSEKRPTQITDKLAQRLAEKSGRPKRYIINPAFHAYLDINNELVLKQ